MNTASATDHASAQSARPWKRAALYLALLGPFFFASYGFANWIASQRSGVPVIVYEWEKAIPFLPWTIVPYWSIDAFYAISLFLCVNRKELDTHALRLFTAQLISVACFLAFPLKFSFDRPATDGVFGTLFDVLMGFDKPFNQAPSLHISLLIVLWVLYAKRLPGVWQWMLHAWFLLIGVSVLTTYQHHFIDIPAGALAGMLCLWLWPDEGATPLSAAAITADRRRRTLALRYGFAALAIAILSLWLGGAWLWLLWGALALALVAVNYGALDVHGFQKHQGKHSLAARIMMAPYLLGAWINSRWWTRHSPEPTEITDDVWLGRFPSASDLRAGKHRAIVDLTCELALGRRQGLKHYHCVPLLDLTHPDTDFLQQAAAAIDRARAHGPVLVCCALGYSRSASALAAWMVACGHATDVEAAAALIQRKRPNIVLSSAHLAALKRFASRQ